MSRHALLSFVAALVVIVSAARCAVPAVAHKVVIDSIRYQPESLTARVGDSVVWVNQDPFPHTVTSVSGAFDSQTIEPNKSWTYTAAKAGDFPYTCTFHPMMKGTLVVK
jgi:plastocyanin